MWNQFRNIVQNRFRLNKQSKLLKEAIGLITTFGLAQPVACDKALAKRKDELKNVKVRGGLLFRLLEIVNADPMREHYST